MKKKAFGKHLSCSYIYIKAAPVTKQTKNALDKNQVTKACNIVLLKCNSRMVL